MPNSKKTSPKFDPERLKKLIEISFNEDEHVFWVRPSPHDGGDVMVNCRGLPDSASVPFALGMTDTQARLVVYLLSHAAQLAEIVEAFKDVVDGTGAEMLESCTGLPYARCKEITKTFAELID